MDSRYSWRSLFPFASLCFVFSPLLAISIFGRYAISPMTLKIPHILSLWTRWCLYFRTALSGSSGHQQANATGETTSISAGLVLKSIGYKALKVCPWLSDPFHPNTCFGVQCKERVEWQCDVQVKITNHRVFAKLCTSWPFQIFRQAPLKVFIIVLFLANGNEHKNGFWFISIVELSISDTCKARAKNSSQRQMTETVAYREQAMFFSWLDHTHPPTPPSPSTLFGLGFQNGTNAPRLKEMSQRNKGKENCIPSS